MFHVADAVKHPKKKVLICTVVSNIALVVIYIRLKMPLTVLWLVFGTGKHVHMISAHNISASIGPKKYIALPIFHAIRGVIQPHALLEEEGERLHVIHGTCAQRLLVRL